MLMSIHKLTPGFVAKVTADGLYSDGRGLYLQVRGGAKSWIFRYARSRFGRTGESNMGLGPAHTISLDEAEELARQCRIQLMKGIDPLEARKAAQRAQQLEAAKNVTFGFCAQDHLWHMARGDRWKPVTFAFYDRLLNKFVSPEVKNTPVREVDALLLKKMLEPIQERAPVAAERTRGLLEVILTRAKAQGYRTGDNPASLEGPLGVLLPRLADVHRTKHFPSLTYQEVGAFIEKLRNFKTTQTAGMMAVLQLEFIILTAVRRGQVHKMRWTDEIDWENRLWNCPWERTKTGKKTRKDHVVPLSKPAMAILEKVRALHKEVGVKSDFIFVRGLPWDKRRNQRQHILASMSLPKQASHTLIRHFCPDRNFTVHGFRATFSSWANDHGYDRGAIETALDHIVGNNIERIYSRDADRLELRRPMMEDWGEYCSRTEPLPGDVIPFRQSESKAR
jgi:integrase